MTGSHARLRATTSPREANSGAGQKRSAASSRARSSARRREAILDAALLVAATGGYDAVQMRVIAERVGIAVGTLYRYFPAKTHVLVAALTREFHRLDEAGDWGAGASTPVERLERLTAQLHHRWQCDPLLTEAMTRAFAVADARAAAELDRAAAVIQTLLARTLSGGEPAPTDLHIAGVISDIWLANLVAFSGHRASAADTRDRIDRATRRLLSRADNTEVTKRYF
ncbi:MULTISPECIES: TetR family transcriptional regulator [Mycobacteriaceae]|uniref:TetR family transcriptional regulator n=1 Tax=Mycobacteriaceae TaxID=1762 RepID=UPI00073FBC33|nr:TetR family transcriptional regulator [Mycobacterium sp. IS-1742]KUI24053.1 TetR family transcriptional regulator [Mycobacterium sp. IS-1742]